MASSTAAAVTWRLGERLTIPWKACATALAALWRRRFRRSEVGLTPLSMEWVRAHEIDSWKHSADR